MLKRKTEQLDRLSPETYKTTKKNSLILVLDNIRSLHNIGSIFRTADAFLIEQILLCGITAQPPHREIHKTALGATETVEWQYFEETQFALNWLKANQYHIVALEQAFGSVFLQNHSIDTATQKTALIIGNEVEGVNQNIILQCHTVLEIPQLGSKHSFNVAVSAGIALWELLKAKM